MKRVMLVFGTRPEAIKMCPLVKEFQKHNDEFETIVCVTGQHREMLDQVLNIYYQTKVQIAEHCSNLSYSQPLSNPRT